MINDFIEYWAAAKLLLSGGNPYSPAELLQAQQAAGWTQSVPLFMWNPPWTLAFIFPIGWLEYAYAQLAWFLLHASIVFVGARVLWPIYGGDPERSRFAWLAVLTFAPAYFALLLGQIGPLILLGVIAFLYFAERQAWTCAGASLALVAIKPHLLYLLWLALLLWVLREKRWRAGVGFVVANAAAVVPLAWNRQIYAQYSHLVENSQVLRPLDWATPSLGSVLGEFFAVRAGWIRWLPSLAGTLWFLWYWSRQRGQWNWISQIPVVLLASIGTASFAWTFDHVVLVPALIQGAVWTSKLNKGRWPVIALHALITAVALTSKIFVRNDFWYFWLAPAYLVFYLCLRSAVSRRPRKR